MNNPMIRREEAQKLQLRPILAAQWLIFAFSLYFSGVAVIMAEVMYVFQLSRTVGLNIHTVFGGVMSFFSCVGGFMVPKLGSGISSILAAMCFSSGLFVSYFVNDPVVLIVTISAVPAIGAGIMVTTTYDATNRFSSSKTRLWLTASTVTCTVASAIGPLISDFVIDNLSWRGACLVYCGILLQSVPISLFIVFAEQGLYSKGSKYNSKTGSPVTRVRTSYRELMQKLCSPRLVVLISCCSLVAFVMLRPLSFIVDLVESLEYSRAQGAMSLTVIAVAKFAGQLSFGVITWCQLPLNPILVMASCTLVMVVPLILLSILHHLLHIMILAGAIGLFLGCLSPCRLIVVSETSGADLSAIVMGLSGLLDGVLTIASGPISGYIRDTTGTYNIYIYILSALSIIVAGTTLVLFFSGKRQTSDDVEITKL